MDDSYDSSANSLVAGEWRPGILDTDNLSAHEHEHLNFLYNPEMFEGDLVPAGTSVSAKGDGHPLEIGAVQHRIFLVMLQVTEQVEQEALDVTVFGSSDAATWGTKPLLVFPQRFYPGETPLLLDLRDQADITYLRAHWEATRWGRGSENPMFTFGVKVSEVAPELLREATS